MTLNQSSLDADTFWEFWDSQPALIVSQEAMLPLGVVTNCVLASLVDVYLTLKGTGTLQKDKSFALPHSVLCKALRISEYQLRQSKKKLKALGVLTITREGIPGREYYHLNPQRLHDYDYDIDIMEKIRQERIDKWGHV